MSEEYSIVHKNPLPTHFAKKHSILGLIEIMCNLTQNVPPSFSEEFEDVARDKQDCSNTTSLNSDVNMHINREILVFVHVVHLVWVSNNTVDTVLQEPEGMSWQNLSLNSEGFPHSRKLLQKLP